MVGVFGCSKKLNYTAISDTVNVASRIETATRIFNSKVLIHSHCVQYLGPKIKARFMGQIEAKGKAEPLNLYEIVEASPEYQALVDITMQVQLLYEAGRSSIVSSSATKLWILIPETKSSKLMLTSASAS